MLPRQYRTGCFLNEMHPWTQFALCSKLLTTAIAQIYRVIEKSFFLEAFYIQGRLVLL